MCARHYDPATGRFLQPDPLGIAASELYAYAANNPYVFWDPTVLTIQSFASDAWSGFTGFLGDFDLGATLDATQVGLDVASIGLDATGIGAAFSWAPDVLNAGISTGRGDFTGAGLSLAAAVPGIGIAGNAARLGRAGENALETVSRVDELLDTIPLAQQGRITMGVGLAEDASGLQRVLIGTSEPRGYLRPGVTLRPGETLVQGLRHAEADIVNFANQNGFQLLEIGATRPICPACAALIKDAGARPVTPLRSPR